MPLEKIRFNPFFDRPTLFLWLIPGKYAKWWSIIGFSCFLGFLILESFLESQDWTVYALYWSSLPIGLITHARLIGSKEYLFLPKFHRAPTIVRAMPKGIETTMELKPKLGSLRVGRKKNSRTVYPAEDLTDLVAPIQIDLEGESAGGYLLESGQSHRVVFAYECSGFPPTLSVEQANEVAVQLEEGLKDFSGFELLTLHYGSYSNCDAGERYVDRLEREAINEESEFFVSWHRRRMRNLTALGRHCPKVLRLYFSYSFDASEDSEVERIHKLLQSLTTRVVKKTPIGVRLESMLHESFQYGYRSQRRFFKKLGLSVRALGWEESWQAAWDRVNRGGAPAPGLLIRLNSDGLKWERLSQSRMPTVSKLFIAGEPLLRKDAVWLPGREQWVGGVVLEERPNKEWDRSNRLKQMEYACQSLLNEETEDTEIIVQFSSADQKQALRQAIGRTKESNTSVNVATGKRRIDKGAELNLENAELAEETLRRGGRLIKCAWVANIYRSSRGELNRALSNFASQPCFTGGVVIRESGYYDSLWSETLPFTWRKLLGGAVMSTTRFDRRVTETTSALLAFTPVLKDSSPDREGVLFIAKDSRTPLYYNPFASSPHGHGIISGFTGSGENNPVRGDCGL